MTNRILANPVLFDGIQKTAPPCSQRVVKISVPESEPPQMLQMEQLVRQFRQPKHPQVKEAAPLGAFPCNAFQGDR